MRKKAISISSDSHSDDDVPLHLIKTSKCTDDPNAYDSLCQRSNEACEFCDRISKTRYSSLIHNASHIIIPLFNQTIIRCPICLFCFTSEEDLAIHNVRKHIELTTPKVSLVKIESDTSGLDTSRCIKIEQPQLKESPTNSILPTNPPDVTSSIKSRLVFEDEDDDLIRLDCNQLLSDLTTDCKVNIEVFDTPWMNGEEYTKSVHYDELVNPGVYRCRKCGKRFPTRYDVIIHESSHIRFKNSQIILCVKCNKYLQGGRKDLRFHEYMFHSNIEEKQLSEDSTKRFYDENTKDRRIFNSEVFTFCEVCFIFCKNRGVINYECLKTLCEVGKRYQCDKCGQLFFEIKLVRRLVQKRAGYSAHKKKKKTNEDRLKTIVKRFKVMKH
nr:testis-specific zinc finger protein topi [Helicoverpa armigera]